jgi:hypothetical protein
MDHRDIIRLWPNAAELASDLALDRSKGTKLVQMWAFRKAIPPKRYPDIVAAAMKRGFQHVNLQALYDAADSPKALG